MRAVPAFLPQYASARRPFSSFPASSLRPVLRPALHPRPARRWRRLAPLSAAAPPSGGSYPVLHSTSVPTPLGPILLRLEDLGGRRRRISGGIDIPVAPERVWEVLTQYDSMSDYMPNIVSSVTRTSPDGGVLLDQMGIISRKLGLRSRILMRVKEAMGESITFTKVEGRDFSEFEGKYVIEECEGRGDRTRLKYELTAIPMPLFPVALVERKIIKEVPGMLESVREESMQGKVVPHSI